MGEDREVCSNKHPLEDNVTGSMIIEFSAELQVLEVGLNHPANNHENNKLELK